MRSRGFTCARCLRWLALVFMCIVVIFNMKSPVVLEAMPSTPGQIHDGKRHRSNPNRPPWMKKYEPFYESSGCQPSEIATSFASATPVLPKAALRRWVQPTTRMTNFMSQWRAQAAVQLNIDEGQHKLYLNVTPDELVVFDEDPCKNTVPLCPNAGARNVWDRWHMEHSSATSQERLKQPVDQRYEVLLLGDSHLRDLARLLCIMDLGGSACQCMNPRQNPPFCHFYYQTLSVTFSWVNLDLNGAMLDEVEKMWQSHTYDIQMTPLNSSDPNSTHPSLPLEFKYKPAVVVFCTGAHLLSFGLSYMRMHAMTLGAMRTLRDHYPTAEIVLMPDWFHHLDAARVGRAMYRRDVMRDHKPRLPQHVMSQIDKQIRVKNYLGCHGPVAVQLERLAVVCGGVDAGGLGLNISIFDLWGITQSVPYVNVTDAYGHHYEGAFGEALALKLVRDHLCRLPEYGAKRYLLPERSGIGRGPGSITDPSHFRARLCKNVMSQVVPHKCLPSKEFRQMVAKKAAESRKETGKYLQRRAESGGKRYLRTSNITRRRSTPRSGRLMDLSTYRARRA